MSEKTDACINVLSRLKGGLVVSCQPVQNSPMDRTDIIVAMARAAENAGAAGCRIEGIENVAAVCKQVEIPVIGITKTDLNTYPVHITLSCADIEALVAAGASVVAVDATDRPRPESLPQLFHCLRQFDVCIMADCATLDDARRALDLGAHVVGSTLSGYTSETAHLGPEPDFQLLSDLSRLCRARDGFVMAEGRFNSPGLAGKAFESGADCVTVGSAITRIEHIVGWFNDAIGRGCA